LRMGESSASGRLCYPRGRELRSLMHSDSLNHAPCCALTIAVCCVIICVHVEYSMTTITVKGIKLCNMPPMDTGGTANDPYVSASSRILPSSCVVLHCVITSLSVPHFLALAFFASLSCMIGYVPCLPACIAIISPSHELTRLQYPVLIHSHTYPLSLTVSHSHPLTDMAPGRR
jgi:hypothetical protein